jgi:hypothetical protein
LGIEPDTNPPFHDELICTYFSEFMVKEIVLDQPGDEQISIVPTTAPAPSACQRANVPNEIVLDSFGVFGDAKSHYLFLLAAETFGLQDGFAVFDARTGKQLFDDLSMKNEPFKSVAIEGSKLTMEYKRVVPLECSLSSDPKNDGAACWEKTRAQLHLDMPMPDCSGIADDIAYDVRAEWDGHQLKVMPVGHSAICGARP